MAARSGSRIRRSAACARGSSCRCERGGGGPKLVVCVTDASYRPAVYAAINRHLDGGHPCSTGIVVKGLAIPELLVEIDAHAVIARD